jgi:hypothetical protein
VTRNLTRGQQRTLLALGGLPTTEQDLAVRVGPRCTVSTTMQCIATCFTCGAPVLRAFNAVQLDPVPVDQGTPGAMSLGCLGGFLWASSAIDGQPQHQLHTHQLDGA